MRIDHWFLTGEERGNLASDVVPASTMHEGFLAGASEFRSQIPGLEDFNVGSFDGHLTFYGTHQNNYVHVGAGTMEVFTFAG